MSKEVELNLKRKTKRAGLNKHTNNVEIIRNEQQFYKNGNGIA